MKRKRITYLIQIVEKLYKCDRFIDEIIIKKHYNFTCHPELHESIYIINMHNNNNM